MLQKVFLRLGVLFIIFAISSATAPAFAVTVTVSPTSASVPVGGTRQLSATVSGTSNKAVKWSVNGIQGGNATVGFVNSRGLYTAPATPPSGWTVTVRATSVVALTAFATCTITVRNQIPRITSVSPTTLSPGAFTLTVNGSRFVSGAQVLWNTQALTTTFISSTQLRATGNATQLGGAFISVANPGPEAVSTTLTVNVVSSLAVSISPSSANLTLGATQQFQATVTGSASQTVTWKVNGVTGGNATVGTITQSGLYTAPTAVPSVSVAVSAVSAVDSLTQGFANITFQNPTSITYGRFLEQATFGPTAQSMTHAQQIGMQAFLDEQFNMPESAWPPLATATRSDAVVSFFLNAANGQDQLRQRVIHALSEVIVISMNKNTNGNEIVPWLQILSRNAFGNYRTLLREITVDASMGKFLDMVNSAKPTARSGANENYAREILQLFSIGLYQLNQNGSPQLDAQGQPIPTYTQNDVRQLALAFTGWTYGDATGTLPTSLRGNYYPGAMQPVQSYHDLTQKVILGQTLPANQTAAQDLDGAIDIIFNHPNLAPFICTRLIRALVTSNPTPAYISRVAAVFNNNGAGVRGDMKAVIRAILLDAEARNDSPPNTFGRLRTPVQHTIALMRALGLSPGDPSQYAYLFGTMGESLLDAPSVFGHYSPMFRIPKTTMFGPEFQIYSATDAVNRANWFYSLFYNPWPINPALQPFVSVAGNSTALINAVDNALLYGRMTPQTRTALMNAMPAMYDNNQKVLTAIYLTATSGEYLVQR
ncbi:MAG: DUF1800 family protein [Acidobacteriota bacterium]